MNIRADRPVKVWIEAETQSGQAVEIHMPAAMFRSMQMCHDEFTFEVMPLGSWTVHQQPKHKKFKHVKETS